MPDKDRKLSFSQRHEYSAIETKIQIDSMNESLRNSLWNLFLKDFLPAGEVNLYVKRGTYCHLILTQIWENFLKIPLDIMPIREMGYIEGMKKIFYSFSWFRIYNLLEFVVQDCKISSSTKEEFIKKCNSVLKRELSAYRFVGDEITKITSEAEIKAIEVALQSPYGSVTKHIETALTLLSDRENPEYRNSVKESISAVESLSKILTNEHKPTLGQLLKKLETDKNLHPALKNGFSALYGYTSSANGIRHSLTDDSMTIGYEEAIYFLVTCSAFVNYLIAKYQEE